MEPMINEMFQSMYETYQESLRIIAMHYKIPRDDVDDIVQETFISYYEHYPVNMRNRKSMLTTILIRKCLDYWRKYRPESISMDSEEGKIEVGNLLHLVSKDIADTVVDKEKYKRLYDCIMEMRDDWKEVILYCCLLDYTSSEAGKILGISGTACRSRLMKARLELKKRLGPDYKDY